MWTAAYLESISTDSTFEVFLEFWVNRIT